MPVYLFGDLHRLVQNNIKTTPRIQVPISSDGSTYELPSEHVCGCHYLPSRSTVVNPTWWLCDIHAAYQEGTLQHVGTLIP